MSAVPPLDLRRASLLMPLYGLTLKIEPLPRRLFHRQRWRVTADIGSVIVSLEGTNLEWVIREFLEAAR